MIRDKNETILPQWSPRLSGLYPTGPLNTIANKHWQAKEQCSILNVYASLVSGAKICLVHYCDGLLPFSNFRAGIVYPCYRSSRQWSKFWDSAYQSALDTTERTLFESQRRSIAKAAITARLPIYLRPTYTKNHTSKHQFALIDRKPIFDFLLLFLLHVIWCING